MKTLRTKPKQRGAAMLEMAFALLFIILPLMFGIIDFSRALYAYHFVSYAAREASRWASVRGSACASPISPCPAAASDVTNFVEGGGGLPGIIPPGIIWHNAANCNRGATVGCLSIATVWNGVSPANNGTADCTAGGTLAADGPGCIVQVTITYRFGFILPLLGGETNNSITMKTVTQMVISQ